MELPARERFTAVTGVSGSGQSQTLVTGRALCQPLARAVGGARVERRETPRMRSRATEAVDKIVDIDQSPIGRTPRSNPATYTGLFGPIRELFAGRCRRQSVCAATVPAASRFNVKGGRCENCKGDGILKIEMQFLPDVYVPCEVCAGKRYNREALEIHYRGHSIADVLAMTAEEALEVFSAVPKVRNKLKTLVDVGLGYIRLGQPATSRERSRWDRCRRLAVIARPRVYP